ncbi:MAG: DNA metabolism protein [Clostridia bacterium]|nr:DNA metabolism protein [Clostridia bacterium]
MSNWKLINKTLLYDGTFDGFLTIVFDCYSSKTLPQKVFSENSYVVNFLDKTVYIKTDFEKSSRVFNGIHKIIGYDTLYNTYHAFLCDIEKDKDINILKYLCDGFSLGPKINNRITISYVYKVMAMKKRAFGECHRLKGLLRFIEIDNNLFYASIHPDNNILEPLGQHFIRRLPTQNFIIHDKVRDICFLYNCKEYRIVDCRDFKLPNISDDVLEKEMLYQSLWKTFFKTIAIKERTNPRCQMQYMPKKYWKDLIEEP